MAQHETTGDSVKVKVADATPPLTYKEQLDEAAIKVKNSQNEANEGGVIGQVLEKGDSSRGCDCKIPLHGADRLLRSCTVSQYAPAVGKVLGTDQKRDKTTREETTKVPGPPERPHHDTQIEEFIKDQHSSKQDDGKLV
jgi:hypothetical protein